MPILKILLIIFIILGSIYWLLHFIAMFLVLRKVPNLENITPDDTIDWPRLSVIIPARNEEDTIESAIKTRLKDDYPDIEILLINDRSTDRTPEIVDRLANADTRIKPIHIKELPEGWVGKIYAMHTGVQQATGQWYLFSDADVHIQPGTLKRVITYALKNNKDHVGLLPELRNTGNLMIDPLISLFIKMLFVFARIWQVEDEKSTAIMGVGAFNLVKRSIYEKTPGFEWLKQELGDDVALGLLLKKSGARSSIINGSRQVKVIFYPTFGAMAKGTERTTFTSAGNFSFWRVAAGTLFMFIAEIFPLLLFIPAGIPYLYIWGIIITISYLTTSIVLNRWNDRPIYPSFLFPIGALLMFVLGIRAGFLGWKRGGIFWRGTFYSSEELKNGRRLFT